jgi:hypothetical protein
MQLLLSSLISLLNIWKATTNLFSWSYYLANVKLDLNLGISLSLGDGPKQKDRALRLHHVPNNSVCGRNTMVQFFLQCTKYDLLYFHMRFAATVSQMFLCRYVIAIWNSKILSPLLARALMFFHLFMNFLLFIWYTHRWRTTWLQRHVIRLSISWRGVQTILITGMPFLLRSFHPWKEHQRKGLCYVLIKASQPGHGKGMISPVVGPP